MPMRNRNDEPIALVTLHAAVCSVPMRNRNMVVTIADHLLDAHGL